MKKEKGNTMECSRLARAINRFYEQNSLPGEERDIFDHLTRCQKCADLNRPTLDLLKALASISPPDAPASLTSEVMKVIKNRNRQHPLAGTLAGGPSNENSEKTGDDRLNASAAAKNPGAANNPVATRSIFKRIAIFLPAAAVVAALLALPFLGNRFSNPRSSTQIASHQEKSDSMDTSGLRVYSHSGDFALHDGKGWRSGMPGEVLADGIRIRVSRGSWLTLNLGTEATYLLGPETIVTILESGRTVNLEAGSVSESVEKGNGRFNVRTPLGTVTVVGTRFDVKVTRGGEAMVGVREGKVKVKDRMGRVRILEKNTAVKLGQQGAGEVQRGVSFLRPIQEVFVQGRFQGDSPDQVKASGNNDGLPDLPEARVPAILLEKDMKAPVTLRDMF
ncbi:MAG: hypothetical protein CVV64_20615 [Candidatus Wallbacteria bacterium HGW-Wallbacteria-1]|jgi:hypothetical protein|uniref:FecR protein domain-containing protein n=1 Tax=Candidatus Wallbacteria bacterium HGW-Wallbacteria-1 TaxID=2013854 RepID=A0A2N1PI61_9BACT|nr:MAG: hypothetical protein CVV64_20615 [Candidatus Wallbacteria bacterium HGW-Wallbacteria-1]